MLKLIIAIGIAAAIFFLITGGAPNNLPKVTEDGFKVEVDDAGTVGEWKDKVKEFFSRTSTSTPSEDSEEGENEADVEFFKKLFSGISKSSSTDEVADEGEEKGFLRNLIEKFKEQLDNSEDSEVTGAFSSKVSNVPSFTTVCFPEIKQTCTPAGCEETSPQVEFSLLDKEESVIAHCDAEGCVTYSANYEETDGYENYQPVKPKGYIISKQMNSDSDRFPYIEAVTEGIRITMYSGYCLERESSGN